MVMMRKLVLKMSISTDGFVCGPNHEIDWLLRTMDKSALDWVEKTLWEAGVHIMGSRTFHDMAAYWVTSSGQLAEPMNKIPKVVFSKGGFVEVNCKLFFTAAQRAQRNRKNFLKYP